MTSVAAFFDVDNTLVQGTIVHYYFYFLNRQYTGPKRVLNKLAFFMKVPRWLQLDKKDRRLFNIQFYKNYRGMPVTQAKQWAQECFQEHMYPRLFKATLQAWNHHRQQNHRVVLVSGSLCFILEPLSKYLDADAVLSARMGENNGKFTGELTQGPIIGETKAEMIREYAAQNGIDLNQSFAYADSYSDLPILETVGNQVLVNPDKKLREIALQRGWKSVQSDRINAQFRTEGKDRCPN